jgi:hypothetical protein
VFVNNSVSNCGLFLFPLLSQFSQKLEFLASFKITLREYDFLSLCDPLDGFIESHELHKSGKFRAKQTFDLASGRWRRPQNPFPNAYWIGNLKTPRVEKSISSTSSSE